MNKQGKIAAIVGMLKAIDELISDENPPDANVALRGAKVKLEDAADELEGA